MKSVRLKIMNKLQSVKTNELIYVDNVGVTLKNKILN